jgi:hypothetical protein
MPTRGYGQPSHVIAESNQLRRGQPPHGSISADGIKVWATAYDDQIFFCKVQSKPSIGERKIEQDSLFLAIAEQGCALV